MAPMNAFANPFFAPPVLTGVVERVAYLPQYLGGLNIFDVRPINRRELWVGRRETGLVMIPTSPIGAPPRELDPEARDFVALSTFRIAKGFTMYAHEVEGLLATPGPTQGGAFVTLQGEYLRRMARLQNERELTEEHMRLAAVQGVLLDADGTTVLYDYYDEFGITKPDPIVFDLAERTTPIDLKLAFNEFAREYIRSSGGAVTSATRLHALAGDEFYDQLITHPGVEKYYNTQMMALRDQGQPFESFAWGGITWHNYRGTDDNTTIAIPTDEARMFPVGAGAFVKAQAPAEFDPWINTMGREVYALNITDRDRGAFTRGEIYAYPLYFCQRPDLLRSFTLA